MDEPQVPAGWHIADTSPSGINRLLPDDCRPISLPYTRNYTAAKFTMGFWVCAGILTLAAVVISVGLHWVHAL